MKKFVGALLALVTLANVAASGASADLPLVIQSSDLFSSAYASQNTHDDHSHEASEEGDCHSCAHRCHLGHCAFLVENEEVNMERNWVATLRSLSPRLDLTTFISELFRPPSA